jgi:hypothetical protein
MKFLTPCLLLGALLLASAARADETPFLDSNTAVLEDAVEVVSDRILAAKWINRAARRPERELQAGLITVRSTDDEAFRAGLHPERFSYFVRPTRYPLRKNINIKSTYVFLFMPEPLKAGRTYTIEVEGTNFITLSRDTGQPVRAGEGPLPALSFTYRGDRHRSSAVHVNQLGYLPERAKIGYLTQHAGAEGALKDKPVDVDFAAVPSFHVVDADTGEKRWEGVPALSRVCVDKDGQQVPDRLSESRVWDLDFSAFREPGRYRLVVPGVGASFPFSISPKIYNQALGVLMRGAYHQRCGAALTEEWTRHVHPACHLDDAVVPKLDAYKKDELDYFPQDEGGRRPCPHGHHDAGDYGKYTTSGAAFSFFLLLPFEVMPERLAFDASPLPEHGNGIPDIIEEVKWELDWLSNMQDPADGAVHTIVKPDPTMSYEDSIPGRPSPQFDKPRSVWWKDLPPTASFAAILARAARTPAFVQAYPEDARVYLEKARKAWAFCMRYADDDGTPNHVVGGHHYGAYQGAVDDYCWAAVELWLTTGEQEFHDYFLKHFVPKTAWNWGWWPLEETAGLCTRAYAFGNRAGKDPEMLKACVDGGWGVVDAARKTKSWQDGWATRVSFAEDPWRFGRWGWYFLSDISSYDLALGATLVPEPERTAFLQAAAFNADQEFGSSADDVVSMTGIGIKRPIDHVHQISRFSGLVEPIPGIPMGFHPAGYNRGNTARPIMSSFMVRELPAAYRYADCWNVEQEFTVQVLGPTLMTYAMLADPAAQRPGRPELAITANGYAVAVTGSAPFRVRFVARAQGANGKAIRDHYWDLSNEEVAADPVFAYTFTRPGIYPVVCSVTDEDGWMSYRTVTVCVAQPPADRPNQGRPLSRAPDTYALWRLDGSLADEVQGLRAELTGNATFSSDNLLWMAQPGGQTVRVQAPADGVRIRLPDLLLNDPAFRDVQVEVLVNYEGDVGSGRGHSKLFVLDSNHDTKFGLQKDTWAGKSLWGVAAEEAKDPTFEKNWRALAQPRAGWMTLAMGFDRDAGRGFLASGHGRVEFNCATGPSRRENTLEIGGFVGYIDEIRVRARRATAANP